MADSVTEKLSELGVRDPEADGAEDGSERDAASDSQEQGSSGSAGPKDQKLIVKFLMSNAAAGAIIGKGGASIAELQDNSGARLQLSRAAEFFPGTADRVMLIAGTLNAVLAALHLVLTKLQNEQTVLDTMLARDGRSIQLRLLVPAALCGSIIGKGGQTIRSIADDSKANITVSSQEKQPPGVPDRVVRTTGDAQQLMRAVALLLRKLATNINYSRFTNNSVSYNYAYGGPPGSNGGMGGGLPYGGLPPNAMMGKPAGAPQRSEVTVSVPEARVGAIIGKGGEVISQLKSVVGVKIRISDREDFVPGTRNRKVTISGAAEAVQIAQLLIQQKINQAAPGPVQ